MNDLSSSKLAKNLHAVPMRDGMFRSSPATPLGPDRQVGASRSCNIILHCAPRPHASRKGGTGHAPVKEYV